MAEQKKVVAVPYLSCRNAAQVIEFYKNGFGAAEEYRLDSPDGRIGHAEISIGGAQIMLADEYPEMGIVGPETLGGTSVTISLEVPDADRFFERAVAAGATVVSPVKDQFYGRRSGQLKDPAGHRWDIGTTIEELSPEEVQKRATAESGS